MTKPRVIIRRAPAYDPAAISKIVREGLEELGLAPRVRGRVTIKPNVVMAHSTVAPSAFTRPYACLFFSWVRRFLTGRL